MINLQGGHVKKGEELNKVLTEYDELFEIKQTLAWKCKEIEWERRILARSLKRGLGDSLLSRSGHKIRRLDQGKFFQMGKSIPSWSEVRNNLELPSRKQL